MSNMSDMISTGAKEAFTTPALEYALAKMVMDMGVAAVQSVAIAVASPILGNWAGVPLNVLNNMFSFGMLKAASTSGLSPSGR